MKKKSGQLNKYEKRIESWKIIIPLYDNKKREIPKTEIEKIKKLIVSNFGGLTSFETIGFWVSGKRKFIDNNIILIVDIPVKDHEQSSSFFLKLKDDLRNKLKQKKIYVIHEGSKSELLTLNEFLKELGFEVELNQKQLLTQNEIDRLVKESDIIKKRLGYRTIKINRNLLTQKIEWEREILGVKLKTTFKDNYPKDSIIFAADELEEYFKKEHFNKNTIVIGDYEYQSYILDSEKQRFIIDPTKFAIYDKGKKGPIFNHPWHGSLKMSEFIAVFTGQVLVNYIVFRELGNLSFAPE